LPFFTLADEDLRVVYEANFTTTLLGCQVFGQRMAARGEGSMLNILSASALRPLTRVVAYGAAKAAVLHLTQWLAVHMATEYSAHIRVNALAPGFFLTEQNGYLMTERETGAWTPRAQAVLAHTPLGRLGAPEDLAGAALWLVSPAAAFVTGAVVPVDGGFTAFSGV
jgi:NAD(P)-dependent dehydrogenase (short-subunit alcohol dehydrogenase family)